MRLATGHIARESRTVSPAPSDSVALSITGTTRVSCHYNHRKGLPPRSGGRESKIKVSQGLTPTLGSGKDPAASPSCWCCQHPWRSMACRRVTLISASIVAWPSSVYVFPLPSLPI